MGRNLLARQVATNGWKLSWISHSSSVVRYRPGFEYLYLDEEVYLRVRVRRIKICEHIMSRHQRVAATGKAAAAEAALGMVFVGAGVERRDCPNEFIYTDPQRTYLFPVQFMCSMC